MTVRSLYVRVRDERIVTVATVTRRAIASFGARAETFRGRLYGWR
jgi:hypothetical protein